MTQPIRTFIAAPISLPGSLRSIVRQLQEMGRAVKAVDAESPHITLKFLGDTKVELLPDVIKILDTALEGMETFEIELAGIGAFPHWQRPTVAWAGVNGGEPLMSIAERLERDLEPLDFPKEKRTFHPHLTLARIKAKPPAELREIAEANETTSFGRQLIDRVVLYQSELGKAGPTYTPLATLSLRPPA